MKKALSLILCMLMLVSCFALGAFAEEETTATEENVFDPHHIVFNAELTGKKNIITSTNDIKGGTVSRAGEWPGVKIEITGSADPHLNVDYNKYISKTGNEPQNIENTPFIVIKVLSEEITFDDFEIYYCAGNIIQATEECRLASNYAHDAGDGTLYFIYNLTDLASGKFNSMRIDILGAEIDAVMYLTEIALFATEDQALEWCGYYNQEQGTDATEDATTEQPTTEQPTTEEQTEAKTEAPAIDKETEAKTEAPADDGCGGVIGAGLITLSLIALGAVCIKKKN